MCGDIVFLSALCAALSLGQCGRPAVTSSLYTTVVTRLPQFHCYPQTNCSLAGDQIFAAVLENSTECAVRCMEDTRCVSFTFLDNNNQSKKGLDALTTASPNGTIWGEKDSNGQCLQFSAACHWDFIQNVSLPSATDENKELQAQKEYRDRAFDPRIKSIPGVMIHYYVKKTRHEELGNYLSFPGWHCGPVYDGYVFDQGSEEGSNYVDKGHVSLERCADVCDYTQSCRGFSHQTVDLRLPGCLLTYQMCSKKDLRMFVSVNFYVKKKDWTKKYILGYEFYVGISCPEMQLSQLDQEARAMSLEREACAMKCSMDMQSCKSFVWFERKCFTFHQDPCHLFKMTVGTVYTFGYLYYVKQQPLPKRPTHDSDDEFCEYPSHEPVDKTSQGSGLTSSTFDQCRQSCTPVSCRRGVSFSAGTCFFHNSPIPPTMLKEIVTYDPATLPPPNNYAQRRVPVVRVPEYGIEPWKSCDAAANKIKRIDQSGMTIEGCREKCQSTWGCTAFTFDPVDPGCVLHRSRCYDVDLQDDCQVHFYYLYDAKMKALESRGYRSYTGVLCRLAWDLRDSRSTLLNCERFCSRRSDCQSWAYYKPMFRCLASSVANCTVWMMSPAPDWMSYEKLWSPAEQFCPDPKGCAPEGPDAHWDFVPDILRSEFYAEGEEVEEWYDLTPPPIYTPPTTTAYVNPGPLLRDPIYDDADGFSKGTDTNPSRFSLLVGVALSTVLHLLV